jgi:hypothetical protein
MFWWINDSGQNTLKGEPAFVATDGTDFRNEIDAGGYADQTGQEISVWLDDSGNPGDPTNPIFFSGEFILNAIHTVPPAREDFFKMLPSLNQAEQDRLNRILARAPLALTPAEDPRVGEDRFMEYHNKNGVRTSGYQGGTRIGG